MVDILYIELEAYPDRSVSNLMDMLFNCMNNILILYLINFIIPILKEKHE